MLFVGLESLDEFVICFSYKGLYLEYQFTFVLKFKNHKLFLVDLRVLSFGIILDQPSKRTIRSNLTEITDIMH